MPDIPERRAFGPAAIANPFPAASFEELERLRALARTRRAASLAAFRRRLNGGIHPTAGRAKMEERLPAVAGSAEIVSSANLKLWDGRSPCAATLCEGAILQPSSFCDMDP